MCIGYACPEAAAGGPIALLRDGDRIRIDANARTITVALTESELAARRVGARPRAQARLGGVLEKYAATVRPANLGAVTHSGEVPWPVERPDDGRTGGD
jgi:dihydroxy-acid dehydratase